MKVFWIALGLVVEVSKLNSYNFFYEVINLLVWVLVRLLEKEFKINYHEDMIKLEQIA
ncbi:15517_t:CDS:2 [Gigaspora margarita]|uniref:15517_t:CDS:1 n=1 Tax=Gigaspora margarita TaxID=4874 RepID=A0ABN7UZB1_GIGMA|nr:15517_t:CDS:2 [Gigaspora margarita]